MGYEQKYYDLLRSYNRLKESKDELERENRRLSNKLYDCEYRIRTELEPMLRAKARSYDAYVLDPERQMNE